MATTTIVGDVVSQIGGDQIELSVLLPPGVDPHGFQPTPQDIALVDRAAVVFMNGVGLEDSMSALLANVDPLKLVSVSKGVDLLELSGGDGEADYQGATPPGGSYDPHVWFNPLNVVIWTRNIARELVALDPGNESLYQTNAQTYITALRELDRWIKAQVETIPPGNRKLVTDHDSFAYLVDRYRFDWVGSIIPGYSTVSAPSARELSVLEGQLTDLQVKALFVGTTINPSLAERVADDTGVQLIFVYTGSLSETDGPAPDYLSLMRYDITAIAGALR